MMLLGINQQNLRESAYAALRRRFVLFMMTTDETSSALYPKNLRRFLPDLVTNATVLIPPTTNEATGVRSFSAFSADCQCHASPPPRPPWHRRSVFALCKAAAAIPGFAVTLLLLHHDVLRLALCHVLARSPASMQTDDAINQPAVLDAIQG